MATPPITSRISPPVDTIVDRELDRARKDFMDLVRTTDRQVRRDDGEGGGKRRDRGDRGPESDAETTRRATRREQAERRAPAQSTLPQTQPPPQTQASSQGLAAARDQAPAQRRVGDRATPGRAPVEGPSSQPRNVVRSEQTASPAAAARVAERRDAGPLAPVGERDVDRRGSGPVPPGLRQPPAGGAVAGAPQAGAARPIQGRPSDAASLVLATASAGSLGLVSSTVGLAPAPYRLSSQTPPEIAQRIAHYLRTGELDRSPLRFAPPSPVADPASPAGRAEFDARGGETALDDAPQPPRLLAPFAQIGAAQAQAGQGGPVGQTVATPLAAPFANRRTSPDRRMTNAPIPMQAAVMSATATPLDAPHVGEDEAVNPFFDDYDARARERRKREERSVVEALRKREE